MHYTYNFYNPFPKYERKLSIVKLFKRWNWVIGTGVYLSDIDKTIDKMKKQAHEPIIKIIETLLIHQFNCNIYYFSYSKKYFYQI